MEQITRFYPSEVVRLNPDRLETLYLKLGAENADDVLCRAMEEMALRMKRCHQLYLAGTTGELRKTVHSLIAIADQIGMQTMSVVARDVVGCIDRGDWVALGATFDRLARSSDQSVTAIWDLQDVPI